MISWSRVTPALATRTSTGPCAASTSVEGRVDRRRVGDVAAHPGQALGWLAGAVGHGDAVAAGRERARDGQPDAAVAAGDQHRASGRAAAWSEVLAHGRDAIGLPGPARRGYPTPRQLDSRPVDTPALGSAPMRAIQVQSVRGPRGPRGRRPARPEPRQPTAAARRQRGRRQLRRHPPGRRRLPGAADRSRSSRAPRSSVATPTGAAWSRWSANGGYAEQALAHPADHLRAARRGRRHRRRWPSSCRAPPRGTCCAPAPGCAPGETVVVHAAAGGVGSLAVQLARELGRRPGHRDSASTADKRDLARDLGADVALDPGPATRRPDRPARRDAARPTTAGRSTSCWR